MNKYIGHDTQYYGVEEHRLVGGKKDGMRILEVRNGIGLDITISLDRAGDISRLSHNGVNMSYMSPAGYVHPSYYSRFNTDFLNSFTAGFLTTCGLNNVGVPCVDNEELPMHGNISNVPVDHYHYQVNDDEIVIYMEIHDEVLFSHKLVMQREIHISRIKNSFYIEDKIINRGDVKYPVCILYHMNMGYPLLQEDSILKINSSRVEGRSPKAQNNIDSWNKILEPQNGYEEECFFHSFDQSPVVSIYNPKVNKGIEITYDHHSLKFFTQWKMMGIRDYVLGLEPGNAHPDGRDKMRKENQLTYLEPNEEVIYRVNIRLYEE